MKKALIIVFVILSVGLAMALGMAWMQEDREAPQIIFNQNTEAVRMGADEDTLLRGVTAYDDQEGDVSDSLKIESIYEDSVAHSVTVTYVAKDTNNNVAKVQMLYTLIQEDDSEETDASNDSNESIVGGAFSTDETLGN